MTVKVPSQEKRSDSYWRESDFGSRKGLEASLKPTVRMLTVCQAMDIKDKNTRQVFVVSECFVFLPINWTVRCSSWGTQTKKKHSWLLRSRSIFVCSASAGGVENSSWNWKHPPTEQMLWACAEGSQQVWLLRPAPPTPPPAQTPTHTQSQIGCSLSADFHKRKLGSSGSNKQGKLFRKVLSSARLEESCCLRSQKS